MKQFNEIGTAKTLTSTFTVLELGCEFYVAKDVKAFEAADKSIQEQQRITGFISKTMFFRRNKVYFYRIDDAVKTALIERFGEHDQLMMSIASLCEGADCSDLEKLYFIKNVVSYEALESHLECLGYPGHGVGLIVAEEEIIPGRPKRMVFLQKVNSYDEGYSVEHLEVSIEMFKAIKSGALDKIFNS